MAVTITKTMSRKLIPLLEKEHDDIEALADELMKLCFEEYEKRAKFAVVMQPHTLSGHTLEREEARGTSLVLDLYPNEGQATKDALSACMRKVQGDLATTWVVPMRFARPMDVWKDLTGSHKPLSAERTSAEKLVDWIGDHPHTDLCEELYISEDGHIQHCLLRHNHEGPHEGFVPVREGAFNNPRRLSGLQVDIEGDEDEPDDEEGTR